MVVIQDSGFLTGASLRSAGTLGSQFRIDGLEF